MEGRWHNGRKTEQIVREAPEVEAYKLGLLESAKKLADVGVTLPKQQVAGMSGLQQEAIRRATAGIGGYEPYLQEAGYTLGDAQGVLGNRRTRCTAFPTTRRRDYGVVIRAFGP